MKLRKQESANALIEFAMIIPVFTILLLGVLNYGLALQRDGVMADAARAGAEAALVRGYYTNTSRMQTVATASAASAGIVNLSAVGTNFCTCSPGSGSTISCSSFCPGYGQPAMYAQVTVSGKIPMLFGTVPGIAVQSVARVRIPCPSC